MVKSVIGKDVCEICHDYGNRGEGGTDEGKLCGQPKERCAGLVQKLARLGSEQRDGREDAGLQHCSDGSVQLYGKVKINMCDEESAGNHGGKSEERDRGAVLVFGKRAVQAIEGGAEQQGKTKQGDLGRTRQKLSQKLFSVGVLLPKRHSLSDEKTEQASKSHEKAEGGEEVKLAELCRIGGKWTLLLEGEEHGDTRSEGEDCNDRRNDGERASYYKIVAPRGDIQKHCCDLQCGSDQREQEGYPLQRRQLTKQFFHKNILQKIGLVTFYYIMIYYSANL